MRIRSGDLWDRTEVADRVDAVQREEGFISEVVLPDTDPAQLVTDFSYLNYSTSHKDDVLLAADPIKRCIKKVVSG
jgi:hypothetical protein